MRVWGVLMAAALTATPLASVRADEGWLECVPFARDLSGVRIFGDARTWWDQAKDQYARGRKPLPGAVMAFRPHGAMTLGHVAVVRRILSPREVRLDHANWSVIDGRRGQIERDVRAVDVSEGNDWSRVRVWFAPIQALGGTEWPLEGFIYPDAEPGAPSETTPAAKAATARLARALSGPTAARNGGNSPISSLRMARIARTLDR